MDAGSAQEIYSKRNQTIPATNANAISITTHPTVPPLAQRPASTNSYATAPSSSLLAFPATAVTYPNQATSHQEVRNIAPPPVPTVHGVNNCASPCQHEQKLHILEADLLPRLLLAQDALLARLTALEELMPILMKIVTQKSFKY